MSQKLETLDFVIRVLLEHEKQLDQTGEQLNRIVDRLNQLAARLETLVPPSQPLV